MQYKDIITKEKIVGAYIIMNKKNILYMTDLWPYIRE